MNTFGTIETAVVPITPTYNVTYGILYPAARELDEVTRAFTRILREVADENVASIA